MKLTAERLREVACYDRETGRMTWRVRKSQRCKPGDPIGSINDKGYLTTKIDGANHSVARLAWLYVTGKWPTEEVDHRDRNRTNNAWKNLRQVSRLQGNQNRGRLRKPARSGAMGVYSNGSRFKAMIGVNGKYLNLGTFGTVAEASTAYQAAKGIHHIGQ